MLKRTQGFFNNFTKIKYFHWTSTTIVMIILGAHGCGSHVYHVVEPGETLYAISWMYGHDYKTVAQWNHIASPYVLHKGQRIRVVPNDSGRSKATLSDEVSDRKSITGSVGQSKEANRGADKPNEITAQLPNKTYHEHHQGVYWRWPVRNGRVIQAFEANNPGKRGIDVAGNDGQTIYSASKGTVVYSGSGLPLYGKLIIIKHNETFLSAYAHNKKLLVKEGEEIRAGQPIARMGNTGTNSTKLHFEIRRDGKPVNPLYYLPEKSPIL